MISGLAIALLALLFTASFASGSSTAATTSPITYEIGFDRRNEQVVEISMRIAAWDQQHLDVHLPVWRPGRYEVLDVAGTVRTLGATDASGAALEVEKVAKSSWRIKTAGKGDVVVRYQIFANAINNRTRHVDDTHAFLSGASVFLFCHERRESPISVRLKLPTGWQVASGLDGVEGRPEELVASNYDQLVDSPIEAGIQTRRTITVANVPHEFAFWGRTESIPESLFTDSAKIIEAQHALFGSFPHRRYVFLTHIGPGLSGGTEHVNSTIIQFKPTAFDVPKDYRNVLALISHEFFHTWNVKNFRPAGLKPYDYIRENYTDLLWVAEGSTSYYDELICVRAGVWTPDQYLEALGKMIADEVARPGAAVQSVSEASFDAWIKFNRPTADSMNSTVSFYTKGALVNFLLDASIREKTGNAKSLDDLMRALNDRFPLSSPKGYTDQDMLAILKELTGHDYAAFYNDFVHGTTPIDPTEALSHFGLELHEAEVKDDDKSARVWTGLDLKDADGAAVVSVVRTDSPAAVAGLMVDDAIVAIDGLRLRTADLESHLKKLAPGAKVSFTLFRRDQLRSIEVTLAEKPRAKGKLKRMKEATAEQKASYKAWLGVEWPG
jgi:predicted metalloprotease with PDZ domain